MNTRTWDDETWQEFADSQLDHKRTPAQSAIRDARLNNEALAALRLMVRGY